MFQSTKPAALSSKDSFVGVAMRTHGVGENPGMVLLVPDHHARGLVGVSTSGHDQVARHIVNPAIGPAHPVGVPAGLPPLPPGSADLKLVLERRVSGGILTAVVPEPPPLATPQGRAVDLRLPRRETSTEIDSA
jgi:hypothetical protein